MNTYVIARSTDGCPRMFQCVHHQSWNSDDLAHSTAGALACIQLFTLVHLGACRDRTPPRDTSSPANLSRWCLLQMVAAQGHHY